VNTALKDQEKSSPQVSLMASSQTTSDFFLFQIKYLTYELKKSSLPNGTCSVSIKKMDDIKQVMKYISHYQQYFWTYFSMVDNQQRDQGKQNTGIKMKTMV
jgi:hypothetical protein